jgi:membrane protease YdiL (CAAX protease family)
MVKITSSHKVFLKQLPSGDSRKKVLLKVLIVGLVGFFLSFVFTIFTFLALKPDLSSLNYWRFLLAIITQDLPIMLLTIVLFYRSEIKNICKQIFPKVANKSALIIFGVMLLDLISIIFINLISYISNGSSEKFKLLEKYINSGSNSISFEYLIGLSQSLLLFLFIAFAEEFVFRFTIFRHLRQKGLLFALLISSILFALPHGFNGIIGALVFGIIIAIYYEYTNYFFGTVIIHALRNLIILYYSYYFTYRIVQLY